MSLAIPRGEIFNVYLEGRLLQFGVPGFHLPSALLLSVSGPKAPGSGPSQNRCEREGLRDTGSFLTSDDLGLFLDHFGSIQIFFRF